MSAFATLNLYLDTECDLALPITLLADGNTFVGLSAASAQFTLRVTPIDPSPLVQATITNGQLAFGVAPPAPVGAQCASATELEALLGPPVVQTSPPGPVDLTVASAAALQAVLTGGQVLCTLSLDPAHAPYGSGSLVANVVGQVAQQFKNVSAVTSGMISGGVAAGVLFEATTPGVVPSLAPSTLAQITTPITGWSSVTNPAASTTQGLSVGTFAFVSGGAGAYYAWSPADTNASNPPNVLPSSDGLGNWLLAPTVQVSIPVAALAPIVGIAQGAWDLLVTWSQGGTSKVLGGTWYCDQSVGGH